MRELGEFIREQRRQAQLSLRKLSEQAGISNPYLSQIERGLRKPSADILQAIARALRISAETLYLRAGFLDSESTGSDVVLAILRDNSITEGQKQTLIEIYHSFRIVSSKTPRGEVAGVQMSEASSVEEPVAPQDSGPEVQEFKVYGSVARRDIGERGVAGRNPSEAGVRRQV